MFFDGFGEVGEGNGTRKAPGQNITMDQVHLGR
jgi:hypothetical protein